MSDKGLTHADLAHRLKISTKSVQRWLNQSIKRMKIGNLQKLAEVLEVSPEILTKRAVIRSRAINRPFENLCSSHLWHRVHANDDWDRYVSLLKTFDGRDLSSAQEATLYKNLGVASLYRGKLKAGKRYLDQSYALAESLGLGDLQLDCLSWQMVRCVFRGDNPEALSYLRRADPFLPSVTDVKVVCSFWVKVAHIHFQSGEIEEGIRLVRRSLSVYYREPQANIAFVAFNYVHLAWAYLRKRDFRKAAVTARRAESVCRKAGWIRGQATVYMLQGFLELISSGDTQVSRSLFGKAQGFKKYIPNQAVDSRIEQMEFLRFILRDDHLRAQKIILSRLNSHRKKRVKHSYAILDALILSRLWPEMMSVRSTTVDRAAEVFERNQCAEALHFLSVLRSRPTITADELLKIYPFSF